MHSALAILSSLAVVSAAGAMGCSSPSSGTSPIGACDTTTPVSFSSDVMPIFQESCTLSGVCHGQTTYAASENLYLGLHAGGGSSDAQAVYKGLVGVPSKEDPSMDLVTASSTDTSFLWHKVNADQGNFAADCTKAAMMCLDCTSSAPCGSLMPYQGNALSVDSPPHLCTIQGWILQGAKNN